MRDGPLEKWWEGWDIFSLHECFLRPSLKRKHFFSRLTPLHEVFFLFLEKNRRAAFEIVNTFKTSWILNLAWLGLTWLGLIHYFDIFIRQHVVLQKPANFSAAVEIAELKEAVSATEPRIAAITENYLKILLPNYRHLPTIFRLDLTTKG